MGDRSKLLEKVTNILKLAEKAGTHAEKLAALEMAQGLIERHNIEEAELEAHSQAPADLEFAGDTMEMYGEPKLAPRWMESLLVILAEHFDCKCWKSTKGSGKDAWNKGWMMGRKSDLSMAKMFFKFIQFELNVRAVKNYSDPISRISWKEGAVSGIAAQLRAKRQTDRKDVSEAGLVILNKRIKAVEDLIANMNLKDSRSRTAQTRDYYASNQGYQHGKNMNLPGASIQANGKQNTLGAGND